MIDAPEPAISVTDLKQLSARLVKQHQLEAPDWDQRSAPLAGRMWISELEPGLQLRLADVEDHYGLRTQAILPAGIKIAVILDGVARIRYGPHEAVLSAHNGEQRALLVALPESAPFTRHGQAGNRERTLTLTLSPHWLARQGNHMLANAPAAPPRLYYWTPSSGLLALASRLFAQVPSSGHDTPHRLQLTGFAMALAGEALALPAKPSGLAEHPAQQRTHDRRLAKLMALIDSGQARDTTQHALAYQLGMSLSTLQRHFSRHYGESLGRFLRRHHLQVARRALQQSDVSIEAAASLAGYADATNFATAFKREYGVQPSEYKSAFKHG